MIWDDKSLPVIELQVTKGNPEVTFTSLQMWMFAHIQYFEFFWWAIWILALGILAWQAFVQKRFS